MLQTHTHDENTDHLFHCGCLEKQISIRYCHVNMEYFNYTSLCLMFFQHTNLIFSSWYHLWIVIHSVSQKTSFLHKCPYCVVISWHRSQWNTLVWRFSLPNSKLSDPLVTLFVYPDSKVHGANMGPTWVLSAPDGPHVVPINLAIKVLFIRTLPLSVTKFLIIITPHPSSAYLYITYMTL